MYFSNASKLSKLLSLILVCVLMVTLFAGCKKDDAANETTDNTLPGLNLELGESTPPTEGETEPAETEATEPKENMGTVTQQMNIRGTPSMQAAVLGTLYAGDRVEIVRRESVVGHTWGYIQNPVEGWVVMDYVEMDDPEDVGSVGSNDTPASTGNPSTPPASTTGTTKGVINGNSLNIRSEAGTNGTIQGSYNKGDVVTILETKDGWGRTDKGWIKMDFVTLSGGASTNTNTNTNTNAGSNVSGNGSTSVVAKGIVRVNELNIRAAAGTDSDRLGNYTYGARVEILEKDGSWGRTDKGWIHMDYVYQDGTAGAKSDWGTVTGDGLNIRSGPGTGYGTLGSYSSGNRVKILEQFTYGNTTWGCTDKGWISLDYVDLDNGNTTGGNGGGTTNRTGIGTVTRGLNVREGAGTNYDIIGEYDAGDEVKVLEATNGWGRTNKGWISLAYVDFDGDNDNDDDDDRTYTTGRGTVTTGLNVRDGAGQGYDVIGGYAAGDRVEILEVNDGWGRTEAGWISLDYVDMD